MAEFTKQAGRRDFRVPEYRCPNPNSTWCLDKRLDEVGVRRSPRYVQIVHTLKVQPESGGHPKRPSDSERRVRSDGPATEYNFVDTSEGRPYGLGQTRLADSQFIQNFRQTLTRMYRRIGVYDSPINGSRQFQSPLRPGLSR